MDQEGNVRFGRFRPLSLLIRHLSKLDLFSKDVVLIPINHANSHWTAAAINFRKKRIESYDSMGAPRPRFTRYRCSPLIGGLSSSFPKELRKYLDDEHRNKKKKPFDFTGWVDWMDGVRGSL
jgi:sentrin-specific protease 1